MHNFISPDVAAGKATTMPQQQQYQQQQPGGLAEHMQRMKRQMSSHREDAPMKQKNLQQMVAAAQASEATNVVDAARLPDELLVVLQQMKEWPDQTVLDLVANLIQSHPVIALPLVRHLVPNMCYPPAEILMERRCVGMIKNFNQEKNFGFIDCPQLKEEFGMDVFMHGRQLREGMVAGTTVNFGVVISKDNKPQAFDLHPAGEGAHNPMTQLASQLFGASLPSVHNVGLAALPSLSAVAKSEQQQQLAFDYANGNGLESQGKKRTFSQGPGAGMPYSPNVKETLGDYTGTVKSCRSTGSTTNSYGFIMCPPLQELGYKQDVFLPGQWCEGKLPGDQVQFTAIVTNDNKLQALNVTKIEVPGDSQMSFENVLMAALQGFVT